MILNIDCFLGQTPSKSFSSLSDCAEYRTMGRTTLTADFISTIDNRHDKEKIVLGKTVKKVLVETGEISNKAIILSLIKQIEFTHDCNEKTILCNALEIIVGITPDDII